jgi:hypothetical protein
MVATMGADIDTNYEMKDVSKKLLDPVPLVSSQTFR